MSNADLDTLAGDAIHTRHCQFQIQAYSSGLPSRKISSLLCPTLININVIFHSLMYESNIINTTLHFGDGISPCLQVCFYLLVNYLHSSLTHIGKTVPLQAWSGSEGSRKLRFPDFMTAQDGSKVVSLMPLPPGNASGTHFC